MREPPPPPLDERWTPIAVARDAETAERWRAALDAAGIDAEVRIDDAARSTAGSSIWPGVFASSQMFAYPVLVPASDRERAGGVLIDHGWDGRHGERRSDGVDSGYLLRGALLALGAAVAVFVLRMAAG